MGYDIKFEGAFKIVPPLPENRVQDLLVEVEVCHARSKASDAAAGWPGGRCCWRPTSDGATLEWDGCEKFGQYAECLRYMIETFLKPWGHSLEGALDWEGEDGEHGLLHISEGAVQDQPDNPEQSAEEEVASWIDMLGDDEILDAQIYAAQMLGCAIHACAESQRAAVQALLNAFEPPRLAMAALETLGELGELAANAVEEVTQMLEHPDPHVRYWATYALGRMGQRARSAIPLLERMTAESEIGPRYGAIDVIKRLTTLG